MALNLVGMIVLARLLSPDDFGLVAIVTVLMGIGALLRDFGMGTAALQEKSLSKQQASNLFWVSVGLSGVSAVGLALLSPIVAATFGDVRLESLVPIMAIVLLLTGLQTQFQAKLAREVRFFSLAVGTVSSVGVGVVAGVIAALSGWGYWALAVQQLSAAAYLLAFYIVSTRWIPAFPRRGVGSVRHVRAGASYGFANILGYAADNVDTVMIGMQWGPTPLGYYNRAFQLFMQPIVGVFSPLTRVVIPTINRATVSREVAGRMLLRVQSLLVGACAVVLVATSATADWIVPLLIGPQWLPVVPLLQILAIGGIFKALSQINYWAYIVAKQSRQLLYSNMVTKPLQIVLIVVASFLSVEAVAWAFVIGRAISWPINLIWLSRSADQRSLASLRNGMRLLTAAVVAYLVTRVLLVAIPSLPDVGMVVVGITVAGLSFALSFIMIPGGMAEMRAITRLGLALRRGGNLN